MTDQLQDAAHSDERWLSVATFAVRTADGEGWHMAEFSGKDPDAAAVTALMRERGADVLEARLVTRGAVRVRAGEHYRPSLLGTLHAHQEGWSFDRIFHCWRAPGEAVADPGGEPECVGEVVAELTRPRFGWMWLTLAAGSGKTVVSMSDVYDPVPDLLRWLEELADGGLPRITIDEEGREHEFLTFAPLPRDPGAGDPGQGKPEANDGLASGAQPDRVRLMILRRREEEDCPIHIDVDRRTLVRALYRALISFERFSSRERRHWTHRMDPVRRYSVRSSRIETYLGSWR